MNAAIEPVAAERRLRAAANQSLRDPGIVEELEATSRAVLAADDAYVREAIASVHWQRRGLLQRLTRAAGPPGPRSDEP
jgi:hypothetical protein